MADQWETGDLSPLESQLIDPASLSDDELIHAAWFEGNIAYMLYPHQRAVYDKYREWEPRALEDDGQNCIFVLDCARRWGKTFLVCLIKVEDCLRRPKSSHTYATAIEQDIGEIVIPIIEDICANAPASCRPEYRTTKKGLNAGYYFPNGSVLKLVGVDKKPKGLRGRFSDGFALTEAAFFEELERPVSKILHQFQRRPWARMLMESSAPEDPDHDFDQIFVPDAKRRGAYVFQTVDDNTQLTQAQKDKYWAAAVSISLAEAERELKGIRSREFDRVIIPDFNEAAHIKRVVIPPYAYTFTAADPGYRHMFGAVFGLYDFDNARLIIQSSWARRNAGSHYAAAAIAAREFALWGTWPATKMKRIPLETDADALGWKDLLRRDQYEALAVQLYEMAQVPREQRPDYEPSPGYWIYHEPSVSMLRFWDDSRNEHRVAPADRVSDVDYQLISSLDVHYGIEFVGTTKSELRAMVNTCRNWHAEGRIVYDPDCGPVLDHLRAGKWAKDRVHFAEHKVYGHYDCIAAEVYLVRLVETLYQHRRPYPPPELRAAREAGHNAQARVPWLPKPAHELELERRLASHGVGSNGRTSSGRMRGWDD